MIIIKRVIMFNSAAYALTAASYYSYLLNLSWQGFYDFTVLLFVFFYFVNHFLLAAGVVLMYAYGYLASKAGRKPMRFLLINGAVAGAYLILFLTVFKPALEEFLNAA